MYVQLWSLLLLFFHFIFVYFTIFILVFHGFITFFFCHCCCFILPEERPQISIMLANPLLT